MLIQFVHGSQKYKQINHVSYKRFKTRKKSNFTPHFEPLEIERTMKKILKIKTKSKQKYRFRIHFEDFENFNTLTLVCLIDEQGLISTQGGIYQRINKRTWPNNCTGWKNFCDLKITAQGLIIAQGKNNYEEYM